MAQLIKSVEGKQLVRIFSGCYLLETTANEIGWTDDNKNDYASFSGSNSGGVNRSFYIESQDGYIVLADGTEFSLKRLNTQFEKFRFDKIA